MSGEISQIQAVSLHVAGGRWFVLMPMIIRFNAQNIVMFANFNEPFERKRVRAVGQERWLPHTVKRGKDFQRAMILSMAGKDVATSPRSCHESETSRLNETAVTERPSWLN